MVRKIIQIGNPILEKKTIEIKEFYQLDVQQCIEDLLDTVMSVAERSAGLSAPQIGISKRICICRRVDLEERGEKQSRKPGNISLPSELLWEVMINPEIIYKSEKENVFWEGCLSIGETEKDTLYAPVSRSQKIEIKYQTREGERRELKADGFFSHVVQHEVDHLDGILFISKVINPIKNIWKIKDLDKYIDKYGEYPPMEE